MRSPNHTNCRPALVAAGQTGARLRLAFPARQTARSALTESTA